MCERDEYGRYRENYRTKRRKPLTQHTLRFKKFVNKISYQTKNCSFVYRFSEQWKLRCMHKNHIFAIFSITQIICNIWSSTHSQIDVDEYWTLYAQCIHLDDYFLPICNAIPEVHSSKSRLKNKNWFCWFISFGFTVNIAQKLPLIIWPFLVRLCHSFRLLKAALWRYGDR